MSEVTTVFQKGSQVKYVHHSLLEANMEDNQQTLKNVLVSSLQERIEQVRQDTEAFYNVVQEMAKDPTTEKLIQLRDKAFEHAENEFEFGSILSRIITQNDSLDEDDSDFEDEDEDFEWADDQLMFNLVEEALELLKNCSELLNQIKHYRRHIMLELDEHDELPRALSGLHDTLLDRLEKLADVRNDF
jgi:hypothetical protein